MSFHLGEKSIPIIALKCPKCNAEITYAPGEDDIKEINTVGIARVGFLHGDHVLLVCFDLTGFIRGAYILSPDKLASDMRVFYKNFRVLSYPRISLYDVEFAIVDLNKKMIDLRASNLQNRDVPSLMDYVESYRPLIKRSHRRVGIAGRGYSIYEHNNIVVVYNNVQPEMIEQIFSNLVVDDFDLMSLLLPIGYTRSSKLSRDSPDFKERLDLLIKANKIKIRAKKEFNAIRFARASIIALWPDLTEIFDSTVSYLNTRGNEGVTLVELISKYPNIDFDSFYEMLRELLKRDIIEMSIQ